MKYKLLCLAPLLLAALTALALAGPAGPAGADGFVKLFNGKNWDGWHLKLRSGNAELAEKVFAIEDGIVHIFNDAFPAQYELGTGKNETHGLFYTNKKYSRYVLRFEYKWGKRIANNFAEWHYDAGCYYHVINDKIWPNGIEYQVRYDHTKSRNHTGDLIRSGVTLEWYGTADSEDATYLHPKDGGKLCTIKKAWMHYAAPTANHHSLDDQWNQCEVIVMGSDYAIHKLNGQVVNMTTNLSVSEGLIGFQGETAEIFYRNIEIKEFDQPIPAEVFLKK